jgi:hypothetical protein
MPSFIEAGALNMHQIAKPRHTAMAAKPSKAIKSPIANSVTVTMGATDNQNILRRAGS